MTEKEALAQAIDMAGAEVCLAWSLGVSRQEIAKWKRVPAEHAARCADLTGIPAETLNHDAVQGELL